MPFLNAWQGNTWIVERRVGIARREKVLRSWNARNRLTSAGSKAVDNFPSTNLHANFWPKVKKFLLEAVD